VLWISALAVLPVAVRAQGRERNFDSVLALSGAVQAGAAQEADGPEAALARIRAHIQALLSKRQPELFIRHLNSVLALCDEDVLRLQLAGTHRDEQANELVGYLKVIETGLSDDGDKPETYLVEGKRSLTLARLSRSDGTLQFYTVTLPPHWDPKKAYPLHVFLHGRGPDVPLAYVHYTFLPHEKDERPADEVVSIVPWLRGNGEWRNENGSEPDIWAIVQRTPDLWAAAGIMAGDPGSAPSELGLLPNARYVPFFLWLGDQDPIPTRRPAFEYFRNALTAVGDPPKVVVANGVGHNPRPQDAAALAVRGGTAFSEFRGRDSSETTKMT
jgi:hypothetical protein